MTKISVALIVRNEAKTIARSLNSVRDYVDEIVVVDTGSTDDTKAIVRQFTDRIFDFVWCDDFGKARQYAFDQVTGDWVFWMDADDILVGGEHLRSEIEALPPDSASISWKYFNIYKGQVNLEWWRERLVRNDGTFHWEGRVHEVLIRDRDDNRVYTEQIHMEHHQEFVQARSRRNLNILEAEVAELGDAASTRTLFYLGNEYMDNAEWEKAIETFRRYLKKGTWDEERYLAAVRIGRAQRNLQRYDEAIDAYLSALKERHDLALAYFGLAEIYYYQQIWDRVVFWAEIGKGLSAPEMTVFISRPEWEYDWIIFYTNALFHVGRLRDALEWTNRALSMRPEDAYHISNKTFFLNSIDGLIWSQVSTH